MPVTLDEIIQQKERLQSEIAERECAIAVLDALHAYAAKGRGARSLDLRILGSVLALPTPNTLLLSSTPVPATEPDPAAAAPALPPSKPYMHPELDAIHSAHGTHGEVVSWAIQRMTDDYTLRDIHSLLQREGYRIKSAEISVVLTRLKRRGQIEEISWGRGRRASVFRKPESAPPQETNSTDPTGSIDSTVELASAAQ